MRARWLLNLALVLLISGLVSIAIYKPGQEKTAASAPLTELMFDTITRIRIDKSSREVIALEKNDGHWHLTAPFSARANTLNVEKILQLLTAPSAIHFPAITNELAKFGLDAPGARLRLDNEEFVFGTMHPLNNQIYLLYKNTIHLIPNYYYIDVSRSSTHFIDSRLLEENRKITGLKLPGQSLVLKDGAWVLQPANPKIASDRITGLVAEWQNARALSVVKSSGKSALQQIEVMTMLNENNESIIFDIISDKPEFVLERRDEKLEYHFTEETGKRLLAPSPK